MTSLRGIRMRLRAMLSSRAAERELDDEIQFHLDQETDKFIAAGVEPGEARRRARAMFGGVEPTKELYRDGRGDRWLSDLRTDLGFGVRVLRRNPTLAATVIGTLALGMGATVALFTVVSAVLLRPLPFSEPERLMALWESNVDRGWTQAQLAPANFLDWKERVSAFSGVAGWSDGEGRPVLTGSGQPTVLRAARVTANFFDVLGVPPFLGRTFAEGEDWGDASRIAVISHRMWQERFAADKDILGRTIVLDGGEAQVVGVMGPSFSFPYATLDVWRPMGWNPADRGQVWFRRAHWMRGIARLKDDVSEASAAAELTQVMTSLEREYPETNVRMLAGMGPLQEFLTGSVRQPLLMLLAATACLLLIACANVGNLLLVRAATREREVVLRRALGAGWGRIVRQGLTESALLAALGGVTGLFVGAYGTRLLTAMQPSGLLPVNDVTPDLRVFAAVMLISAASAALFGISPSLWLARRPAGDALRDSARGSSEGMRARRWVNTLAVVEVALAVLLTVGAGLFVRSYDRLNAVHPGFDVEGVVSSTIELPSASYSSGDAMAAFYAQLMERASALPGVTGVAVSTALPLTSNLGWTSDFSIRGRLPEEAGRNVHNRFVTSDYFRVMKEPVLSGRAFDVSDNRTSEPVVIINQALADQFFPGQDPLGQFIANDLVPDSTSLWRRIVGVVGNEQGATLGEPPRIALIVPILQNRSSSFHLIVRTDGDPGSLVTSVDRLASAVDPMVASIQTRTMSSVRLDSLARERFLTVLLVTFALAGAVLAVIGVYGVVAQLAQRRVAEMQIRLALGASVGAVYWLIIRHGLLLTIPGTVAGMALGVFVAGRVRDLLFGVAPWDPLTLVLVGVLIVPAGLWASWLTARRVGRSESRLLLSR